MSSLIRLILDEIFGPSNFRSEIIWKQTRAKSTGFTNYGLEHNTIFYYISSENPIWNIPYKDYDEDKFDRYYCYFEQNDGSYIKYSKEEMRTFRKKGKYPEGKQFALIPLERFMEGARPNLTYEYKGFMKTWSTSKENILRFEKNGLVVQTSPDAVPQKKQYLDDMQGKKVGTIWDDIYPVNSQAKEKLDYPTQKPEALLERIIEASSQEGDIVCDFFCGSGTTLAVAEKLGRKWIGADLGKFAIHTTRKRMLDILRQQKSEGKNYRAFEILNLGKYERQHYIGVNPNLRDEEKKKQLEEKEQNFVNLILHAYRADKASGFKTFHGKKNNRLVAIGPINLPVTRLFVEEVILECREKHITKVDVLGFEFEMGLFPNIQEEAKNKGIDLSLKYIPREVFDKRAVEKNQVVFHDVSYIELKPHFKSNSVAVELTDFSVFYNQDTLANVESTLKNGATKIVVENGKIIKVSKDKSGIVSKELLTKSWTDWIDYWAVDFNFENKKEFVRVWKEQEITQDGTLQPFDYEREYEEVWTGDYVFENEWQSFRTRKDKSIEMNSIFKECKPGRRKIAVKVVDIFGNDTMKIIEVTVGGKN